MQKPAAELLGTFFLVFAGTAASVINDVSGAKEKGITAGISVGAVIALEALFAGPITAASMNPARFLAPALVSAQLANLLIYLTAPVLGALLAVLSCRCVQEEGCCPLTPKPTRAKLNQGVNHGGSAGNAREPAGGERMAARGLNRTSSHARLRL